MFATSASAEEGPADVKMTRIPSLISRVFTVRQAG
jgi:hypothetical protein